MRCAGCTQQVDLRQEILNNYLVPTYLLTYLVPVWLVERPPFRVAARKFSRACYMWEGHRIQQTRGPERSGEIARCGSILEAGWLRRMRHARARL
jgi:hypothetical protein